MGDTLPSSRRVSYGKQLPFNRSTSVSTEDFKDIEAWSLKTADMLMGKKSSRALTTRSIGLIDLDTESIFAVESEWDGELGISPSKSEDLDLRHPQTSETGIFSGGHRLSFELEDDFEVGPSTIACLINAGGIHFEKLDSIESRIDRCPSNCHINQPQTDTGNSENLISVASTNHDGYVPQPPPAVEGSPYRSGSVGSSSVSSLDAGHVKMQLQAVLRLAEQEIQKLNEQVSSKSYNLELAQKAMISYEEEILQMKIKLQLLDRGSAVPKSQVPDEAIQKLISEEEVLHKLVRVKSDASKMRQSLGEIPADNLLPPKVRDTKSKASSSGDSVQGVLIEQLTLRCQRSEEEVLALKGEKERLQEMLRLAEEEAMMVLSETHDADEEVQTYLRRLDESQRQREKLERDLRQAKADLIAANKQIENFNQKRSVSQKDQCVNTILVEAPLGLQDMAEKLEILENANSTLRDRLQDLTRNAEVLKSLATDSSRLQLSRSGTLTATNTLYQDITAVEIATNEKITEDKKSAGEIEFLREALNLALEANKLLEAKVAPSHEVSVGLRELEEEVKRLHQNLVSERKKNLNDLTVKDQMILELQEEHTKFKFDMMQLREALSLALEAKTELELRLEDVKYEAEKIKPVSLIDCYPDNLSKNCGECDLIPDHLSEFSLVDDEYAIDLLKEKLESGNIAQVKKAASKIIEKLEEVLRSREIELIDSADITSTNSDLTIPVKAPSSCCTTSVKSCESPNILSTLVSETPLQYLSEDEDEDRKLDVDSEGYPMVLVSQRVLEEMKRELEESKTEVLRLRECLEGVSEKEKQVLRELDQIKEELSRAYEENVVFLRGFAQIKAALEEEVEFLKSEVENQKLINADILAAASDLRSLQKEISRSFKSDATEIFAAVLNSKETTADTIRKITRSLSSSFKKLMADRALQQNHKNKRDANAIRKMLEEEKTLSRELKSQVSLLNHIKGQYVNYSKDPYKYITRSASEIECQKEFSLSSVVISQNILIERSRLLAAVSEKDLEIQMLQNSLDEYISSKSTLEMSLLDLEGEIKHLNAQNKKLMDKDKDQPKIREIINIQSSDDIACELSQRIVVLQEQIQDLQEELMRVKLENSELKTSNGKLGKKIHAI